MAKKREEDQRRAVVEQARSWIRTPFHDCAAVRGVGIDCANLLARSYIDGGVVETIDIKPYSPQWFLHRSEELFIGHLLEIGAHEIPEEEARAGDCVVYKIGRCFAHGAIVSVWPDEIIHAHKPSRCTVATNGLDGELRGVPRRFFSMW